MLDAQDIMNSNTFHLLTYLVACGVCRNTVTKLPWSLAHALAMPGVILHELSHALAAWVLGGRVTGLTPYRFEDAQGTYGGHVDVSFPGPFARIRLGLAALAPIFSGGGVMWAIAQATGHGWLPSSATDIAARMLCAPLLYSIASAACPSGTDIAHALRGLALPGVLAGFALLGAPAWTPSITWVSVSPLGHASIDAMLAACAMKFFFFTGRR